MNESCNASGCPYEYGESECAQLLAEGNCPVMIVNEEGEVEWL